GQTLSRGLKILDEETAKMKSGDTLKGDVAFTLYDTYGFPMDLTRDALKPRGIDIDEAGFETAMQKQREMARAAWAGSGEAATETLWFELSQDLGATEFVGYDTETAQGVIKTIIIDGKSVDNAA